MKKCSSSYAAKAGCGRGKRTRRSDQDHASIFRGDKINTTDYREVELKAPFCKLRSITAGTFNDFATWNLNFLVRTDPVSGSRFINRVRHSAGLTYK